MVQNDIIWDIPDRPEPSLKLRPDSPTRKCLSLLYCNRVTYIINMNILSISLIIIVVRNIIISITNIFGVYFNRGDDVNINIAVIGWHAP